MSVVLIVDDEEALLEILATVIRGLGHQVIEATNGKDALQLARTHRPALVVSDYMMPGCSGLELLRAVRADEELAKTPFVLISAATPLGREQADLFLEKPVPIDMLEDVVRRILPFTPTGATPEETSLNIKPAAAAREVSEQMIDWLAHELQVPLAAAKLTADSMRKASNVADPELREQWWRNMTSILEAMESTIAAVLEASKLANEKISLVKQPRDFVEMMSEMVDYWREFRPDFQFVFVPPHDPVVLEIDAMRVRQIVNNLITNAVKYSSSAKQVDVTIRVSASRIELDVADLGVGMAAEELPRIFNRFHRTNDTSTPGHGLGLFIASELTLLHRGSLRVKSALGKGSTFTLVLPRASGPTN